MDKTLSIKIRETRSGLVNVINDSELPADVLQMLVKDLLVEITQLADQAYQNDMKVYAESLKKVESADEQASGSDE